MYATKFGNRSSKVTELSAKYFRVTIILNLLFTLYCITWLAFLAEGCLADVCQVFAGKYESKMLFWVRGKPENLNGAHTVQPTVTNRANSGVSE